VWLGGWLGAAMSGLGWFARRSLVAALRDGARSSNATLAGIVRLNARTAFGRRYGFEELIAPLASATATAAKMAAEREVVEAFKVAAPLATYDDLAPWVAQVAGGEQNVLTAEPIIQVRSHRTYRTRARCCESLTGSVACRVCRAVDVRS
jgi:hypothetical protein